MRWFLYLGSTGSSQESRSAVVSSHWGSGQSSTGCSFLRNRNLPCCYASFAFGFSLNVFYLHEMFALNEESRHICYGLLFFLLVSDSHKGRTFFASVKITALFWQLNVLLSFLFWKSGFSVSFLNGSSSISVLQSKPSLESSNLDSMRLKAFLLFGNFMHVYNVSWNPYPLPPLWHLPPQPFESPSCMYCFKPTACVQIVQLRIRWS